MPVGPVPCIGLWREPMSLKKPEPEPPLRETIREHWSDKLELGGSKDGYVACYAANQVLGTVWRGSNENADTKEIRDTATLCRLSGIGPRDVIEAMLAAQMVATHEAALECFRRAALAEQTFAGRELGLKYADKLVRSFAVLADALEPGKANRIGLADADHPPAPGSAAGSWSRLRRSRSSLPALKRGTALPGTATSAPVRGLRPTRPP